MGCLAEGEGEPLGLQKPRTEKLSGWNEATWHGDTRILVTAWACPPWLQVAASSAPCTAQLDAKSSAWALQQVNGCAEHSAAPLDLWVLLTLPCSQNSHQLSGKEAQEKCFLQHLCLSPGHTALSLVMLSLCHPFFFFNCKANLLVSVFPKEEINQENPLRNSLFWLKTTDFLLGLCQSDSSPRMT